MEKPQYLLNEHLEYLDELRESGDTNMYGAKPFLMDEYPDLGKKEAGQITSYWMKTFSERHPQE